MPSIPQASFRAKSLSAYNLGLCKMLSYASYKVFRSQRSVVFDWNFSRQNHWKTKSENNPQSGKECGFVDKSNAKARTDFTHKSTFTTPPNNRNLSLKIFLKLPSDARCAFVRTRLFLPRSWESYFFN
ncbi:hypothetical protein [Chryseobacterium piperi]|uniref:hypothetical protein n=1 Tax=Chryseobacterium piperi TaxID=558152 RepID=UPI0012FE7DA6|nr:hypothetical protein [Chryseobacterium piperi]